MKWSLRRLETPPKEALKWAASLPTARLVLKPECKPLLVCKTSFSSFNFILFPGLFLAEWFFIWSSSLILLCLDWATFVTPGDKAAPYRAPSIFPQYPRYRPVTCSCLQQDLHSLGLTPPCGLSLLIRYARSFLVSEPGTASECRACLRLLGSCTFRMKYEGSSQPWGDPERLYWDSSKGGSWGGGCVGSER